MIYRNAQGNCISILSRNEPISKGKIPVLLLGAYPKKLESLVDLLSFPASSEWLLQQMLYRHQIWKMLNDSSHNRIKEKIKSP
jgi:hypothetical protein